MNDIVERLRTGFDWDESASNVGSLIQYGDLTDEAADEIEFLRKQLTEVTNERGEYAYAVKIKENQLAECQAREKVLLQYYDEVSDWLRERLDMPSDSTALDEAIKQAKRDSAEHILEMWRDPWTRTERRFIDRLEAYVNEL